jgi:hypothetical protein
MYHGMELSDPRLGIWLAFCPCEGGCGRPRSRWLACIEEHEPVCMGRCRLRRHGGRFANHWIFAFLIFHLEVRSRNRRVSLLSVSRKSFPGLERVVHSLSKSRLDASRKELEEYERTSDDCIRELLKSISLYRFRQPRSRERRRSSRRKIMFKVGQHSVFGRTSQYFGAVDTNDRGALHIHGLLWLHGNVQLGDTA